jgi:hypothetical protein
MGGVYTRFPQFLPKLFDFPVLCLNYRSVFRLSLLPALFQAFPAEALLVYQKIQAAVGPRPFHLVIVELHHQPRSFVDHRIRVFYHA